MFLKLLVNRPNLFYEVRPKTNDVDKELIKFIKEREGESGIIYTLSRKSVERLVQTLQVKRNQSHSVSRRIG